MFQVENGDLKWEPADGEYEENHQQHDDHLQTTVCLQLPTSADNMSLLACAAERRAAAVPADAAISCLPVGGVA